MLGKIVLLAALLGMTLAPQASAEDQGPDAVFLRTAVFVTDLEPAVAFFRDVLGYREASRSEQTDAVPGNALGLPAGAKRRLAMLTSDGGAGVAIMEVKHPDFRPVPRDAKGANMAGDVMFLHLVKSVDAVYRRAVARGYTVLQPPAPSTSGKSRQIFLLGPGGLRIEAHEYVDPALKAAPRRPGEG
jgi:catechol 2,3-dioxygenase-like lactoylglutathione lyase family enzyme